MQRLTSRQRLVISLSLYMFGFLTFLFVTFFLIFRVSLFHQVDIQVQTVVRDILTTHVKIENEKPSLLVNKDGKVLAEELQDASFSAIFFDKNLDLVRGFGVFSYFDKNQENTKEISSLLTKAKETLEKSEGSKVQIYWRGREIYGYFVPLNSDGKTYGVALIGKDLDSLKGSLSLSVVIFLILGAVGLIGSLIMGEIFVRRAFKPIRKLTGLIQELDFFKLDRELKLSGNPKDELVIMANKFNEMIARLKLTSGIQKQFVANVSHELKTPLTKAILNIEVLLLNKKDKSLEEVRKDLFELSHMIDKLLELGKVSRVNINKMNPLNLKSFFEEINQKLLKNKGNKKTSIKIYVSKDIAVRIPKEHAEILFSNLIGNAIKHSPKEVSIVVQSFKVRGGVGVTVEDRGEGIEKSEIKNIFNPFYRGENSKKGYGVGLSLVKQICDVYGIKISVESEKDKGTKFTLVF